VAVRIGSVRTATRGGAHALLPLPEVAKDDMQALLMTAEPEAEPVVRAPEPLPPSADVLIEQIAGRAVPATVEPEPDLFAPDHGEALAAILADMAAEEGSTFQPLPTLYQDFSVRARMKGLTGRELDLDDFRRRFAMAAAGIADPADPQWGEVLRSAAGVPDDLLGPYLLIARAAQLGEACPDDGQLARIYGTSSPGRIRRLIEHLEKLGLIVLRTDFGGRRSIGIPALGLSTAPLAA
jgi:hypothetical protein